MTEVRVRPLGADERAWANEVLRDRWTSTVVARRGGVVDASELDGLVAELDGRRVGLLTYALELTNLEVVTLDALEPGQGVGSALLAAAADRAAELGCARLWLITTNDNLPALRFYQRNGWRLLTVHHGAVAAARLHKPTIPQVGHDGIPITDELELERLVPEPGEEPA